MSRRVVVTGLGALTPLGNDVASYWEGLRQGVSGSALITKFDTEHFKTKFACELKNFDVQNYLDRKEARKMDPCTQYGVIAAAEAIRDAGLEEGGVDPDRAGVIWGSGIGGLKTFQEEVSDFATGNGVPRYNPFFIPKMIVDITPRSYLDPPRLSGAQLRHRVGLCFGHPRHHRRLYLHQAQQSGT